MKKSSNSGVDTDAAKITAQVTPRHVMPTEKEGDSLALIKKKVREIVGFTFYEVGGNPENWFSRACEFNAAAKLLADPSHGGLSFAYYYNAGISIELAFKAIILAKSRSFDANHKLIDLSKNADINLTTDQNCTLELLSEIVLWSGRYPIPKSERQWDNYHDVVFAKHIVKDKIGNTRAHKERFPSKENYIAIWNLCENTFNSLHGGTP